MRISGHAVFRCDASAAVGAGHLVRCLALSEAFAAHGWRCTFIGDEGTEDVLKAYGGDGIDFVGSAEAGLGESGRNAFDPCDLFVVDHYGWDATSERRCRSWAARILTISDKADRDHDCDYLVDHGVGAKADDYMGHVPADCAGMFGPGFGLLRGQFAATRAMATPCRRRDDRNLVVSIGATDPENFTALVLQTLAEREEVARIDVILGANAPHLEIVRRQVATMSKAVLHVDVRDMAGFFVRADLCIGATGSSTLERLSLDLPTLVLVIVDNQQAQAQALRDTGLAEVVGLDGEITVAAMTAGLDRLTARLDNARPGTFGALDCDGRGAARVAAHVVANVAARDGAPVTLRQAIMSDARRMYDWQTAPEVRRVSRNKDFPAYSAHVAWVQRKLLDPACWLEVVEYRGQPVGIVRLDKGQRACAPGAYEVSILVAPECQNLGIGMAALALARKLVPGADLLATVLAGNDASFRLFESARYEPDGGVLRRRADETRTAC